MCVPQHPFTCSKHSLPTLAINSFSFSFCAGVISLDEGVMARCFDEGLSKTRERGRAMAMAFALPWLGVVGSLSRDASASTPLDRSGVRPTRARTVPVRFYVVRAACPGPSASHQKAGPSSQPPHEARFGKSCFTASCGTFAGTIVRIDLASRRAPKSEILGLQSLPSYFCLAQLHQSRASQNSSAKTISN